MLEILPGHEIHLLALISTKIRDHDIVTWGHLGKWHQPQLEFCPPLAPNQLFQSSQNPSVASLHVGIHVRELTAGKGIPDVKLGLGMLLSDLTLMDLNNLGVCLAFCSSCLFHVFAELLGMLLQIKH